MAQDGRSPAGRRVPAGPLARMQRGDPHTLVGAYVMDAVSDGDRSRFEQHLTGCETCRDEVRGLREATGRLAAAAEIRPRAELREQTMLAAGLMRQLPPVTRDTLAGWPARRQAARRGLARAAGIGRPRAWRPRLAAVAVAGLAAAALLMGTAMHGADHRLSLATGRSHAIAAVLNAPDVTMLTAQIRTGGRATVVLSRRDRSLVFTTSDLRPLSGAWTYQLWLMGTGAPRPAGLLPAPRRGISGPMVVPGLRPGDRVGLTIEPAGGSRRPTFPAVLMLGLPR